MKFGKEFAAQMVQEWQEAYMDYNNLKTTLKDVLRFIQRKAQSPSNFAATASRRPLKRRVSLYRTFSGLTSRYRVSPRREEDEVILVTAVQDGREEQYQTTFLNASEEGGQLELVFFERLDKEFNKVVGFYRKKVEEVLAEAEDLSRQMDALIALRIKVEKPVAVGKNAASASVVHSFNEKIKGRSHMNLIQEVEMTSEPNSGNGRRGESSVMGIKPAPLEVLDRVKIKIEPETPVSTMKNIIYTSKTDLSFSKEELRKAEGLITRAFVEFYQKLRLLRRYCFLNQLAFSKIMKKYDKITSRKASKAYLKMVDNSYLGSSDEVTKLMERVEKTFIKHFSNGNHREGMDTLRPIARREKHRITFLLGLFSGCSIALSIAMALVIHTRNILNSPGGPRYMENMFPLYSIFGFIALHMLMHAADIYFWRRYRVNYAFIFGFKQGTELGYREVFLFGLGLMVLALGGVLANLDMEMDPRTQSFKAITELIPLGLLLLLILITIAPFNIIYRSSRFFLMRCALHCLCAPLYKVTLPDFFLADQLTSQVPALRRLEFYVCYYGWGDFKRRSNTCSSSKVFESFYFLVAMVPYWIRFLQCLRRLFEEERSEQGYNALKYLSTVIAVAMTTSYDLRGGMTWKILAAVTAGLATIISTYWDIVIDWGLMRRNSRNPWLRDKLLVQKKSVYFLAMGLNVVLRLAWMQTVFGSGVPSLHRSAVTAILASLEIVRRGIWNFFRLENEHLNNVGKYRAFKSVPLPFHYDDVNEERRV